MDEPCDVVSLFPSSFVAFVAGLKPGFAPMRESSQLSPIFRCLAFDDNTRIYYVSPCSISISDFPYDPDVYI